MRPRLQLRAPPAGARACVASPLSSFELGGAGASRLRAAEFLRRLDRMLDQRPVVERDSVGHTVWVFGAVGFRVNRRLPGVYPVFREEDGRLLVGDYTVELFRPLRTHHFLSFVLRRLGLSWNGRQRELFRSPARIVAEENQLLREAWRRLRRDPRFEELRSRRLPAALGLDPVLRAITLAARRSLSNRVACDEYSFVWRHERALRVVARENPGLMPIVVAALQEQRILPCGDAVKELHLFFRYRKLSPATWRWLAHHGCRVLRPVWEHSRAGDRTDSAVEFLREIERAGHPAPPPAWAVRAWLASAISRRRLDPGWNPVPSAVVASCLGEALRARGTGEESLLGEDLRLVFSWAARETPVLDKLQRRAGWSWVLRRAVERERRRLLLEVEGPRRWPCAVREVVGEEFVATAVETVEGLVDEAMAFHNCIAGYAGKCQEGWVRIFVVRERVGGRRVGVVRLDCGARGWEEWDVLGVGNARVAEAVRGFAVQVAGRYDELMRGVSHEGERHRYGRCLIAGSHIPD